MRIDMRYLLLCTSAVFLFALGGCNEDVTSPVEGKIDGDVMAKQTSGVQEDGLTRYEGIIGGENQSLIITY